jgi:hypothetical protein
VSSQTADVYCTLVFRESILCFIETLSAPVSKMINRCAFATKIVFITQRSGEKKETCGKI